MKQLATGRRSCSHRSTSPTSARARPWLPLIASGSRASPRPDLRHVNLALGARLGGSLLDQARFPARRADSRCGTTTAPLDRFLADAPTRRDVRERLARAPGTAARVGLVAGPARRSAQARHVEHDGPVAVLTMGRRDRYRLVAFLKHEHESRKRGRGRARSHLGHRARPPALRRDLFDLGVVRREYRVRVHAGDAHNDAIAAGPAKPFHHQEAFVRFRPYATRRSPRRSQPASRHGIRHSAAERAGLREDDEVVAVDDLLRRAVG